MSQTIEIKIKSNVPAVREAFARAKAQALEAVGIAAEFFRR